jgi:hypothetical protein
MLSLLHATVPYLREFLEKHLPQVSKNWWDDCVYNKLTMMQREIVDRKNIRSLSELDFAALLRIVDQNWFSLSNNAALGPEVRSCKRSETNGHTCQSKILIRMIYTGI